MGQPFRFAILVAATMIASAASAQSVFDLKGLEQRLYPLLVKHFPEARVLREADRIEAHAGVREFLIHEGDENGNFGPARKFLGPNPNGILLHLRMVTGRAGPVPETIQWPYFSDSQRRVYSSKLDGHLDVLIRVPKQSTAKHQGFIDALRPVVRDFESLIRRLPPAKKRAVTPENLLATGLRMRYRHPERCVCFLIECCRRAQAIKDKKARREIVSEAKEVVIELARGAIRLTDSGAVTKAYARTVAMRFARKGWPKLSALALASAKDWTEEELETIRDRIAKHRFRSNEDVTRCIALALDWLLRYQRPEGHWAANEVGGDGKGDPAFDVGITGLVLACLNAERTAGEDRVDEAAARAVRFLLAVQEKDGCFGRKHARFMYSHCIATMALAQYAADREQDALLPAVQRAVQFVLRAQTRTSDGKLGWAPDELETGCDTSVTGWAVAALVAADRAGILVPNEAFAGAETWIERMTDSRTGRIGFQQPGVSPMRTAWSLPRYPPSKSEAMTASGMTTRLLLGLDPNDRSIRGSKRLCLERLPIWNEGDGSIDHYYWYFGTRAMVVIGGKPWRQWRKCLLRAIVDHQRKDGDVRGSWDPVGAWGQVGGRIYSTAILTRCLQVARRGEAMHPEKKS